LRRSVRHWFTVFAVAVCAVAPAWAAPDFPELTGRVVDKADILSASAEEELTEKLARQESQTTNQIVVVTLESL
jgi:uncharacterized protein